MTYVIGIDIGTEGTKLLLLNEDGQIVKKLYASYTFDVPKTGWSEQDPEIWWEAFLSCIRKLWDLGVQPSDIRAIGVSGQMHSSVLLDMEGNVITKSILWNDNRTQSICEEALHSFGHTEYQGEACNSLLPGFTLGKILWLRSESIELYQQIEHVLMPKDFINYRLTNVYSADVTDASGTGVFDVRNRTWSSKLIDHFELEKSWFPPVFESGEVIGVVSPDAGRITGLLPGTPVIAGAADNAAAAVGMGIVDVGMGLVSIGTSGVVLSSLDQPLSYEQAMVQNPTLHVFCHAVPGMWYGMGVTLSAGASLRWFKDSMDQVISYDELMQLASKADRGSSGLIYLPFLTGERTPYNSDHLRAGFLGLHLQHKREHMVRSVIEGVSYSLRECLDLIRSVSSTEELVVTGGVVNSDLWLQVLADILETPLIAEDYSEGAAYGVAILAGRSQGMWSDWNDLFSDQKKRKRIEPVVDLDAYRFGYTQYKNYAKALLTMRSV